MKPSSHGVLPTEPGNDLRNEFSMSHLGTPLYKPEGFRTRRWRPCLYLTYAF